MKSESSKNVPQPPLYLGGVAAITSACICHPLDILKVLRQTESFYKEKSLFHSFKQLRQSTYGYRTLYIGLTASIGRQATYSTVRFALYDYLKTRNGGNSSLSTKIINATFSGAIGGFVGTPFEIVLVRMQGHLGRSPMATKLYRNVFHGLFSIVMNESYKSLFQGLSMTMTRAVMVTVGQLAIYDQLQQSTKNMKIFALRKNNENSNNILHHFVCSLLASGVVQMLTMPVDTIKTRRMYGKQKISELILDGVKRPRSLYYVN
ncbi:hypothetical protein SNEBB_010710 [Seison nebaliae]|nr:hypothetical protein SNEBB_010710 [Seison nebaliae]